MYECPACGSDVDDVVRTAVAERIADWRSRGLLSPDKADELQADVGSATPKSTARIARMRHGALSPATALLVIGGILVVSAVVMVATELWDDMMPFGRFAVAALPAALCYGAAALLRSRRMASDRWIGGLSLIGSCLAPFVIWLAFGMTEEFEPRGSLAGWVSLAAALGLVIQIATLAWLRYAALTLPPSAGLVFLAGSLAEWLDIGSRAGERTPLALTLAGVALMACGQTFMSRGQHSHAGAPNAIGVAAAMVGLTVLGAESNGRAVYEIISLLAPLALIFAACTRRFRVYLWAGAAFLVINTFRVGLSHFGSSLGLPIVLMMCGSASILIGYVVHRVRKDFAD